MTTTLTKSPTYKPPRFRARFNWPLIIGLLLVGLVIYLAIVGPTLAPYDPMAENVIIKDAFTGEWHMPPFKAFEVTGYPLGSDEFGRDLYSRLLWAIRPTLQMVAVVAAVRLVLGTLIGLVAGWSTGRVGRFLDSLIAGALALPGLLVALGTIAVVGVELGLFAFVIGLSVTGWAETARIVREQTRMIKSQVYIEAAHALGSSGSEIVSRHIVRQIQAMLLMLLAFEISSTLMLTAGLGFLGYYIGGDVWVDVSDYVARRTSGAPELGQMLATAWVRLTDPWGLVSVGSVVFALVLGFNLIGEGLRLRLSHEVQGGILRWLGERLAGVALWYEDRITFPIWKLMERPVPFAVFRLVLGMALGATAVWGWNAGWFKLPEAEISFLFADNFSQTAVPNQGTAPATTPTPETQVISVDVAPTAPPEPVVVWTFDTGSIITGPPVISPDGTVYLTTADSLFHALAPDGSVKWQVPLPARPVESPALAADGTLYVTDAEGGLNSLSPDGTLGWRFVMDPPRPATSGPSVASDGNIYYALGGQSGMVQAVSPAGEGLWLALGQTFSYYKTPVPAPEQGLVFLWNDAFNAADGTLLSVEFPSKVDRFLMGHDGKIYYRTGHNLVEWQWNGETPDITQDIAWNYTEFLDEGFLPQETGVTKHQISWELYTTEFGGSTTVFWIEVVEGDGRLLGLATAPVSQGHVAFMDEESLTAVVCGLGAGGTPKPECYSIAPEQEDPLWGAKITASSSIVNSAYDPAREMVFLTTETGTLYAVDTTPNPGSGGGTVFELPTTPVEITDPVVAWEYRPAGGFAGAPITTEDGTIYLAENGGKVVALNQDGTVRWETVLDPAPGAGLERAANGTLLVPDVEGGLAALDEGGTLLWHFTQPIPGLQAASKPIIPANGVIYYAITDKVLGYIQAVTATGEALWRSETATTTKFYTPPSVNAAGDLVFLAENVFDAADGHLLTLIPPADFPLEPDAFLTGLNGKDYIREENTLYEWRRNGTQIEIVTPIEWQFRAEDANNPAASISAPHHIRIAPDSTLTLWYRYNVVWLTEIGESRGVAGTLTEDATISTVVYEGEDVTYTCGITLSPTEPSSEQCMGFELGTEKPLWKINLGSSPAIGETLIGGARIPAGFVFASLKGVLYGIMEQSIAEAWETAQNQPTPEATSGGEGINPSAGWVYEVSEPLLSPPLPGPDGSVYIVGESQMVYRLASTGVLSASFALPAPLYIFQGSGFDGGYYPLLPSIMADGSVLVVTEANQVYALHADGSVRWEFAMERPPFSDPVFDEVSGHGYLTDDYGTVYAFAPAEGLLWQHDVEEGLRAASPWPVFGSNGEIFYTITNRSTAKIEALNSDGSPLWRTDLTTFKFYRPLEITQDRSWVILDDDLVNTETGHLLNVGDLEFNIEEVALGYDGKQYLIAGSTIMQWEVTGDSIQILNQVTVSFPPNRQTGIAPELSVSKDGIYWIRFYTGFGARQINMWVNAEGEVLGLVDVNVEIERIIQVEDENNLLSVCKTNIDENRLECRGYDGKSNTPTWQVNIEGMGVVDAYYYADGRLFVQVDEDTIQVIEVVLP